MISDRARGIEESPTLALSAEAKRLEAAGVDVKSFTAGEPDFDTPEFIKEACRKALAEGRTKYTPAHGLLALRQGIARENLRSRGFEVHPEAVCATSGAKPALYHALLATCNPGDEVIVPAPYWVSYLDMIRLVGARPVIVHTREENGFALEAAEVRAACSERTRLIVYSNPQNPTGAVQPPSTWAEIVEALPPRTYLLSDEIYRKLSFEAGGLTPSVATLLPDVRDRTIIVDGVSKSHAMTGWRIGWSIGPRDVIDAMKRIQSHTLSNPSTPAQYAAMAALDGDESVVAGMRDAFRARRDRVVAGLRSIRGITVVEPQGAFYAFPNVSAYLSSRHETTWDLCRHILDEARVALVPGEAFGAPGFVRFSYATGEAAIEEGLARLSAYLGAQA